MSALTIKRRDGTRHDLLLLADLLATLRFDGEDLADLVADVADTAAASAYMEYGSIDLYDVADKMRGEVEAFAQPSQCGRCSGSGEGQYSDSTCTSCHGRGEHPSPKQVAERERMGI